MNDSPIPSLEEMGVALLEFTPSSCLFKAMDQIEVMTKDVTSVTHWHGKVFLETVTDGHSGAFIGFHLVSASHLRGEEKETDMFRLLARGWWLDMKKVPLRERASLSKLYLKSLWILIKYPETRKLNAKDS